MTLTKDDLDYVARLVHEDAGIVIDASKGYLVLDRLDSVARRAGLDSVASLVRELRGPLGRRLHENVVEALTTNETLFFRDDVPFETLAKTVLPWFSKQRRESRRLSVWCAAASTGQEPYSIAMTMRDALVSSELWHLSILATDISPAALERARAGRYTSFDIGRGLPEAMKRRWFEQDGRDWVLREELRRMVDFKRFNLLQSEQQTGPFDLIFVRNVLIYFDLETKSRILRAMTRALAPDGLLVLGAGESILKLGVDLVRCANLPGAYYAKPGHPLL